MLITPFATIYTAHTALLQSSSVVTGDVCCYSGHAHASYLRQGQHSVLLVMYSAYNAFGLLYSHTLAFFGSNWGRILLLGPYLCIYRWQGPEIGSEERFNQSYKV